MNIINCYPKELGERAKFGLMNSQTKKMSDLVGVAITPEEWILYTDDSRGEDIEVLTIKVDGDVYGTISATFIRAFKQMVDFFGTDVGEILVNSGTSKAGREYITCEVVW